MKMLIIKILFWLSLVYVFYASIGYLIFLRIFSLFWSQPVEKSNVTPAVTLLIAARNEEKVIAGKLENSLALDYPAGKLEIIVVSDASDDNTDAIVRSYADRGVILKRVLDGNGKVNALNAAFHLSKGEILVISDADSEYRPDAIRKLAQNFADPKVGAVTGEEIRVAAETGEGTGEGIYARLDNQIKRLEGKVGSVVMVNGGFFAIRRERYPILEPHLIHDSIVPCRLQLQGFRTVYEPEAVSVEVYALDVKGDFRRRLRTVIQAFYSYLHEAEVLNPFRTGFFAIAVLSHRFSRWFVFPFLVIAFPLNLVLPSQFFIYQWLLVIQILCYLFAVIGYLLDRRGRRMSRIRRIKLFYLPYYFLYIHAAAFLAVMQGILGKRVSTWHPAERASEKASATR